MSESTYDDRFDGDGAKQDAYDESHCPECQGILPQWWEAYYEDAKRAPIPWEAAKKALTPCECMDSFSFEAKVLHVKLDKIERGLRELDRKMAVTLRLAQEDLNP